MHEITVKADLLGDNDRAAHANREVLRSHGVYTLNLMSAPGAGKTTLLERTVDALRDDFRLGVIEGDVQGRQDAERIGRHGVPVRQINTGHACHLDARMVARELPAFDLHHLDLLLIENVGNLVCPAEFDLGEHDKAMVLSVTEGDDKPEKYPVMFHVARALVLSKIDLLPHVDFDLDRASQGARRLNPGLAIFPLSATTGTGLEAWLGWLRERRAENAAAPHHHEGD